MVILLSDFPSRATVEDALSDHPDPHHAEVPLRRRLFLPRVIANERVCFDDASTPGSLLFPVGLPFGQPHRVDLQ